MSANNRAAQLFVCFLACVTIAAFIVSIPLGLVVLGLDFLLLAYWSWIASKAQPIIEEIVSESKKEAEDRLSTHAHDLGSSIVGISKDQAEEYAGPAPEARLEIIPWYRKAIEERDKERAEAKADSVAWRKR